MELLVKPADGSDAGEASHRAYHAEGSLRTRHERWVDERKAMTEELSGGRLGYIFIPEMNSESYKRAYSEVIGDYHDKEGLVIDIRYNMGGNIHDQLITLFTGRGVCRICYPR
jgi:tricorn protease